ncbi:receptor-type tyrosine-protein phosphatase H [Anabrus simplex]|uniref:receptor-type tyrosine-protein phosphatase H n=1 Tax=Anabrus simplex TaxID=316456 RepID=UPI0035A2744C
MMVHLILVLLNLLAVNAEDPLTTNIPETSSYSVDESTFYPHAPAVVVSGGDRSLTVQWNITGCILADVTGYTVSVIPQGPKGDDCEQIDGIVTKNVTAGEETEITFSDLQPYYDYQVDVTVNTKSGEEATGTGYATTAEGDPPAPAVVVSSGDRSLTVQWNITGCVPADVTGYTVSVIPQGPKGGGCEQIDGIVTKNVTAGEETEVIFSDLQPYYDYQVDVTVNTKSGEEATGTGYATTAEGDPHAPAVVVSGGDRSLTVQWNITGCVPADVTGYTVSVIPQGPKGGGCEQIDGIVTKNVTAGEETEVIFSDLQPYYDYQVDVTVNTKSGEEATGTGYATTAEGDPPAPAVVVSGGDRSLTVQWNITGCIPADVTGYTVSVIPQGPKGDDCEQIYAIVSKNVTAGEETEVTFSDLQPYYDYQVDVTVNTKSGEEATGIGYATTAEGGPPAPAVVVSGGDRSLTVQWNITGCIPAYVTGYTVSVIPQGPKGDDCKQTNEIVSKNVTAGEETEVTFSDLQPYYDYQVDVTVNTKSGEEATGTGYATTAESDPPAPAVVVSGGDRSLSVQWNITGCIPADVTGYTVSVIPQGPKGDGCEQTDAIVSKNVTAGEETEVTFSDLQPYYDYQVNVTVNTKSGEEATGTGYATTAEGDPHAPAVVVSGGDRSLTVQWNITGCIPADVTGYTVSVIPQGPKGDDCKQTDDIVSKNVTAGEETEVTFSDLQPYYDYQVDVTVNTKSGEEATGTGYATTAEGGPPAPAVVVSGGDRSLTVQWNITGCVPADVTGYTVSVIPQGPKGDGCEQIDGIVSKNVTAGEETEVTFSDLQPYYDYQVDVTVNTKSGEEATGTGYATTAEGVPPRPREKRSKGNSRDIELEWELEKCVNGIVLNFNISLFLNGYLDKNECGKPFEDRTEVIAASEMTKKFEELEPYSMYTVVIAASTAAGFGPPLTLRINTTEYAPEPVTNLHAADLNATQASLFWKKPCRLNGQSVRYELSFTGTRKYFEDHKDNKTVFAEDTVLTSLRPEYSYIITVIARNENDFSSEPESTTLNLPANIPRQRRSLEDPDPYATDDSTTKAKFTFYSDMFNASDGSIEYYAILLAENAKEPESGQLRLGEDCHQWRKPENIHQATPRCWNPFPTGTTKDAVTISYIIGDNATCDSDYCNEPLTPGRKYHVTVRVYTKSTYADAKYVTLDTDSAINVGLIAGAVLSLLLLGCCILISILYHRRSLSWPPKIPLLKRQMDAQPKPVSLTRFPAYSDYMLGVPARISNEYHMLQTFSKDIADTESCCAALQPENKRKNRYSNILPFDSTRVVLDPLPEDPSSDYINASFIRGYSREVEYIATQGPKEETCFDFWRMVYQHGVKIIIMLTNLRESDKVKCHEYFPSLREHLVFGDITIRCTTELVFPIYTSRSLQLLKDNTQRSIVHLHFREWPDFGCPTNPDMLLQFSQAMRHQMTLMKPCITVVHCSAGVGRTGTLIAIDILLQHIREHKKVDIFGTVFNLRRQRMFMVQSECQYVHIYHCIKAALTDPKFLESEKNSTSSTEPIYENIENGRVRSVELQDCTKKNSTSSTEPIYENIENGRVRSVELQDCTNGTSGFSTQRVHKDGEKETYHLITSGSVNKSSESECEL